MASGFARALDAARARDKVAPYPYPDGMDRVTETMLQDESGPARRKRERPARDLDADISAGLREIGVAEGRMASVRNKVKAATEAKDEAALLWILTMEELAANLRAKFPAHGEGIARTIQGLEKGSPLVEGLKRGRMAMSGSAAQDLETYGCTLTELVLTATLKAVTKNFQDGLKALAAEPDTTEGVRKKIGALLALTDVEVAPSEPTFAQAAQFVAASRRKKK